MKASFSCTVFDCNYSVVTSYAGFKTNWSLSQLLHCNYSVLTECTGCTGLTYSICTWLKILTVYFDGGHPGHADTKCCIIGKWTRLFLEDALIQEASSVLQYLDLHFKFSESKYITSLCPVFLPPFLKQWVFKSNRGCTK